MRIKARFLFLLACAAALPQSAFAFQFSQFKLGNLEVAAWLPDKPAGAPVILFSHAFHSCNMYTQYLSKAFADAGYAVFAPNHRDNVCTEPMKRLQHPAHQFNDPMRWTDTTYADRRKDMETVLNTLSKDKAYAMLDWDKVAAAGHSLGGYTALGIAGAWPAWKDPRIKAVLALSPYSTPFIFQRTIKNVTVPVMYQGGTRDTGITPYLRKSGGAYDQSHTPKFFLELEGAEHAAWSYSKTPYAQTIEAYSIAFLDAEFKKKTFPKSLMKSGGQVKTIRVDQQ